VLRRLLLGELPPAELESLGQHVLHCDRCAGTLNQLRADAPLLQTLRGADTTASLHPTARSLIDRLSGQPTVQGGGAAPAPSSAPGKNLAPPPAPAAGGPAGHGFLGPPQGPGELGRLGGYRVLKLLGQGGMGAVYLGEDPQLERPVALKVMLPEVAARPAARQRFLREAKATAKLKDNHVVAIYQVGEDNGVPFLAMEYLRGESLDSWLTRGKKASGPRALRIARDITRGLAAAHAQGLIHRDIKPANLWLEAPQGRVKILDFGLARGGAEDVQLTQTGTILGTPAYMAPEQARGAPADARSDLFSLGCVLYRLYGGRVPFEGPTVMAVLTALATEDPVPLGQLNPQMPEDLAGLVMRLLAKRPADRPPSAQAVLQELQAIDRRRAQGSQALTPVPDEVTVAVAKQPPPRPAGPRRWMQGAGGLLLVGVAAGVLGGVILHFAGKGRGRTEIGPPDGSKLTVDDRGGVEPGLSDEGVQTVLPVPGTASPLDKLDPTQIPAADRFPWQPPELVAVVGDHRQAHFSLAVGIAVTPDGKRVVSASQTETCLWDAATMRRLAMVEGAGTDQPALTSDGRTLALGGRLWDLGGDQFKELATIPYPAASYAFAPGDRLLAAGGRGEAVLKLWRWANGKLTEQASLRGHTRSVTHLAFTPDGKTLISGDGSGEVRVWDLSGPEPAGKAVFRDSFNPALAPDGRTLATTSAKGDGIWLWDLANQPRQRGVIRVSGASALCFAPDGRSLAVSRPGLREIDIWPADPGARQPLVTGAGWVPRGLTFGRDGHSLFAIEANTVLAFEVAQGTCRPRFPLRPSLWNSFPPEFTPDGRALLTNHNGFDWWDLGGPAPQERPLPDGDLWSYGVSADSRRVAVGKDGALQVLEWAGEQVRIVHQMNDWPYPRTILAPDGRTVVGFSSSGEMDVAVWDVSGPQARLVARLAGHAGPVAERLFTPDGRGLITTAADKTLHVWRRVGERWRETAVARDLPGVAMPIAVSPRGDLVGASIQSTGVVRVWELHDGALRERVTLKNEARGLTFLPDGRTLATASTDGKVHLWDWQRGEVLRSWQLRGDLSQALAAAPDGRHLAVRSGAGAVYVLRLAAADGKPYPPPAAAAAGP
jgi:WD40 repeat protein/predicted Ser/Thr protein kinase